MIRKVLGVAAAFVLMSVGVFGLSIAPWLLFGLDAVMQPARFDTTLVVTGYSVFVGLLGALLSGWLCARITASRAAVVALAALCFLAGAGNAVGQLNKPVPGPRGVGITVTQAMNQRKEPAWFTLLMPLLGVAGVLVGGRRAQATAQSAEGTTRLAPS